jgi:hypothetical protein
MTHILAPKIEVLRPVFFGWSLALAADICRELQVAKI